MKNIETIIFDSGMSSRPCYYSGYPATLDNLDSKKLLSIQSGIRDNFGEKASKAFVEMVKNIKVLTATTFLNELYALCRNEWVLSLSSNDMPNISVDTNVGAWGTVLMGMFGDRGNRDDTIRIRANFLASNGMKSEIDNLQLIYGKYK